MSKEKIEAASLKPQIYIDKPPEYVVVEVTRENYELVAEWLKCHEMLIKKSGGVVWEVTFKNVDALNTKGENADDLTASFTHEPGATHYRRLFIIRDENYNYRLVTYTTLESKYINIPQEASIIE